MQRSVAFARRAWPNPELGAEVENFNGAGALRGFDGAESTFSLSQEIELGGQRSARVRLADRDLHGAELDRMLRGLDLLRDVQTAYYDALAAQELVAIARERLVTAEALERSVARRVAAARDPLIAGARAEAGVAEARIALTRAEAEAATARASRILLGRRRWLLADPGGFRPARRTPVRNTGSKAWIISEETSMNRLTKPSAHTVRGILAWMLTAHRPDRSSMHPISACWIVTPLRPALALLQRL